MSNAGGIIRALKEDAVSVDKILYPGNQLGDFDSSKLKIDILPCGFPSLDEKKFLKRNRGELILIGARPSQGKSGLGFQIATGVAKHGKVHVFSLEMDHESVAARQVSIAINRPLDYIQSGRVTVSEVERTRLDLSKLNFVIDDRSTLNIYQICDAARMQNKKGKTDLIVIDYIQIISYDRKANIVAELGEISLQLKNLARELRIPIIALSQLNRNSEYREAGEPQLSDLKGSGQLEQDADIVALIHRTKEEPTLAKIIIAKNRNGSTGEVEMEFAPAQVRFIDKNLLD